MTIAALASRESWEETLNQIFSIEDEQLEAWYDSVWAPDIEATIDGAVFNRESSLAKMKGSRAVLDRGSVKVLYLVREGNLFAERHTAVLVLKNGTESKVEAYVFGELAEDGRVRRMDEAIVVKGTNLIKDGNE